MWNSREDVGSNPTLTTRLNNNKIKVMSKINLPKLTVALNSKNPETQNILISTMILLGVPVYEDTTCFDPAYPYVYWDGDRITQTVDATSKSIVCETVEEFLSYFVYNKIVTIALTDEYDAKVTETKVIVGCQTISFEKVEEVYNTMVKLRKSK